MRVQALPQAILIRRAELPGGQLADVRIERGCISAIGELAAAPGDRILHAHGGMLLPGLHDHHAHIAATAASLASVRCGPPQVTDEASLAAALAVPGAGWLRGTGYHESVAGLIDRHWLDGAAPHRPVRVQHRSGRLWIVNTIGLDVLRGSQTPAGLPCPALERDAAGYTGRLYDADSWLGAALGGTPPGFADIGALLARYGVTGVTDMTPANGRAMAAHFARERDTGALPQHVVLAGRQELSGGDWPPGLAPGPLKIHLHEAQLPDFDAVAAAMKTAHAAGRAVAVHCVTEVELLFTLAAFGEAGARLGDRIEHASVANAAAMQDIESLHLAVVTQPNFIAERGDAYRADMPPETWPHLYRLQSWRDRGITLAGGTDTPFGGADPWAAMAAAVARRTASGATLGEAEALTPEAALELFLADPLRLDRTRRIAVGGPADLCLLHRPWAEARAALSCALVRATLIGGALVHLAEGSAQAA